MLRTTTVTFGWALTSLVLCVAVQACDQTRLPDFARPPPVSDAAVGFSDADGGHAAAADAGVEPESTEAAP